MFKIMEKNLSLVNQEQWKEAKLKSNPYQKLDSHYFPYIAGYTKRTNNLLPLIIYRILEVVKSVFGKSDRQQSLKIITSLIKAGDTRFILFPANQAKESAKVVLELALKANEREKKNPNASEEDIYVELMPWLQKKCIERNIQLGTIRNIGLSVLNFLTS